MSKAKNNLNDDAWEKVFKNLDLKNDLANHGFAYVSAEDLKQYGDREPRLMAKFDTKESRPELFKKENLSILPVSNGYYIVFKDYNLDSYFDFNSILDSLVIQEHRPGLDLSNFQTLPKDNNYSESQAIDYAYLASVLRTFTNERDLYLTIRGRLRSGQFQFNLPNHNHTVNVSGVQIELDAGYESPGDIYLIEAKVGKRDNFHIRQLYYPYREWLEKTSKNVVPIFFTYTNGLFYLTKFEFGNNFGDLRIVDKNCYTVNDNPYLSVDLDYLLNNTKVECEPSSVPYPQANDVDKIIDVVKNIENGYNNKFLIASYFEFRERQGDYYANAARYLGFLTKTNNGEFRLTETGKKLAHSVYRSERNYIFLQQLLKRPTFHEIIISLKDYDFELSNLDDNLISSIISKHTSLTSGTPKRRASTVKSWLKWIVKNVHIK
ncbi:conserved hypothetical protein [Methanohalobium evestigatum Z-7303]|uniref:Uncharacterized protein n=1 Tax=Methanohalobium evestigatum (strain ATCC BAA-1072 / DSM 3721 / NBRC 107634 / OCM 161 / Z-7303) TaxID=644295 RepID=D7E6V0_METEZ|nr:hypothetical protein [Methanohalobium evestigatum]ADI73574.1 conserved hypothetical protein [Methanohalobium evestigatum Z-7303]